MKQRHGRHGLGLLFRRSDDDGSVLISRDGRWGRRSGRRGARTRGLLVVTLKSPVMGHGRQSAMHVLGDTLEPLGH